MIPDNFIKSFYFIICIVLSVNSWAETSFNISFSLTGEVVCPSVNNSGIHLIRLTDFTAGGVPSSMFSNMGISLDTPKIKGNKLVGMGAVGDAQQGYSVSISADGKTAIVGGPGDDDGKGAVWIYRNESDEWRQEGIKLVGSDALGNAQQGYSVSISADGNTAIVGGPGDDDGKGAAWIYRNVNGIWRQVGNKLVGKGANGMAKQGASVCISAEGKPAIVGGPHDQAFKGAVWLYRDVNGVWHQEGNKLVGKGAEGMAKQGTSVSLSSDGQTAIVSGFGDHHGTGAAWIYRNLSGEWVQEGNKLIGSGARGDALQGWSVSLSADGKTAIVGGPEDYGNQSEDDGTYGLFRNKGAVWIYRNKHGDLFTNGVWWRQEGIKLVGKGAEGNEWQGNAVDLSEDGNTAVVGGREIYGRKGAVWVYRYVNGIWRQDEGKLVWSGAERQALYGYSISLSGDGKTAIIGGPGDDGSKGAVWIYSYVNGVWVQY